MLPIRSNNSSPSFGTICDTTHAACCPARGVQSPSTIPTRSSIGTMARAASSVWSLYSVRSTRTGPAAVRYSSSARSTRR
jgi:hypothetical protein